MQSAAAEVEQELLDSQLPSWEMLKQLMNAVRYNLTEAESVTAAKTATAMAPDHLAELLSALHPALLDFDTEALHHLQPLAEANLPADIAGPVAKMVEAANSYDFSLAAALCEQLLSELATVKEH